MPLVIPTNAIPGSGWRKFWPVAVDVDSVGVDELGVL
jgi:hypothetical protein